MKDDSALGRGSPTGRVKQACSDHRSALRGQRSGQAAALWSSSCFHAQNKDSYGCIIFPSHGQIPRPTREEAYPRENKKQSRTARAGKAFWENACNYRTMMVMVMIWFEWVAIMTQSLLCSSSIAAPWTVWVQNVTSYTFTSGCAEPSGSVEGCFPCDMLRYPCRFRVPVHLLSCRRCDWKSFFCRLNWNLFFWRLYNVDFFAKNIALAPDTHMLMSLPHYCGAWI